MFTFEGNAISDFEVESEYTSVQSRLLTFYLNAWQNGKNITVELKIRFLSEEFLRSLSYDLLVDFSDFVLLLKIYDGNSYHVIKDGFVSIQKVHFNLFRLVVKVKSFQLSFIYDMEIDVRLSNQKPSKEEQGKIILLFQAIEELKQEFFCICDSSLLDDFIFQLSHIFPSKDTLTLPILEMIGMSSYSSIFKDSNYGLESYSNHEVLNEIMYYINEKCKLYFDYEVVKNNIVISDLAYTYLSKRDQNNMDYIKELVNRNPKVLLRLDICHCTEEFILEQMKKNDFVSCVFAGIYGLDNCLYKYSSFYQNNLEIVTLLYVQLKEKLYHDPIQYKDYSELAKNNIALAKIALKSQPKLIAYTGDLVRKDKEIMLDLLKQDRKNIYYVDDSLKQDLDIMGYM